jgi:TolB-like protein/Tfp pilus assembly protein PilF
MMGSSIRTSDQPAECDAASRGPVPHDVKKAVDFIRESAGRPISLSDLAAHCGVPARSLHKHFRNFLGLSPISFWRRVRLAAARAELLDGADDISVTDVAARAGFNHFGRFAQQYRRAFGEAPSATLRRNRLTNRAGPDHSGEPVAAFENYAIVRPGIWRDRPSVAIMPYQVSATAPECRSFAEYLAEGLAAALCRIHSLSVVAPKSLSRAKQLAPNGSVRDLRARYVLAGRVAQIGERVRVVIRLIDAKAELQIWGDAYDGTIGDLFGLQDRITESVTPAIAIQIRGSEIERARRKPLQDLDAHGMTARAMPLVSASSNDTANQALDLLNRAMEADPDYAPAAALAAWCHAQLVLYNGVSSPEGERHRALMLSDRAAVLDPDDPLVLTARCAVQTMAGQLDHADTLVSRALARDPSLVWAWERSAWLNAYAGRPQIAIRYFGQATKLDPAPMNANCLIGIGCAHFDAGHYQEAALWKRSGLQAQPNTAWINRTLSVCYARLGNRRAALDSVDRAPGRGVRARGRP